jgi:hypothetical protein
MKKLLEMFHEQQK